MEKEVTIIDKNGEEITKNISCILQLINSTKFMARSLSNLVNCLSEGVHEIELNNFLTHTNFLTNTTISLFCYCQKGVFPYQYMDDCKKFKEYVTLFIDMQKLITNTCKIMIK